MNKMHELLQRDCQQHSQERPDIPDHVAVDACRTLADEAQKHFRNHRHSHHGQEGHNTASKFLPHIQFNLDSAQ